MDIVVLIQTVFDGFSESYTFAALKIFFIVYSVVLVLDILFLLSFRDIPGILRQGKYGTALEPSVSKAAMNKRWAAIERRLQSENPSEYKVAILEAELLAEGLLKDVGYDSGTDMAQKLEQLKITQPADADALLDAHRVRNRIVFEEDFQISLKEAREILEIYKDYLRKYDYFE